LDQNENGDGGLGYGQPGRFVIVAGGLGDKRSLVAQPVVSEPIELSGAKVEPLLGGQRVQLTGVERRQDFPDIEGWNPMSELGLFILGQKVSARTAAGQGAGSFSLWTLVEEDSAWNKTASVTTEAAAESLN